MPIETREAYLMAAVEKFRPIFKKQNMDIPPVKVSCGFPFKNPRKNIGECWDTTCTADGTIQIFISPVLKNGVDSLGTLSHELIHACLPAGTKHGAKFKEGMKLIGLEGKAIHAGPGPELQLIIEKFVDELGVYPNPTLKLKEKSAKDKAQSKKSFKLFCPNFRNADKCCRLIEQAKSGDYTVTVSRKSLKLGFPLCPGCAKEMEMETDDFELYKLGNE